MTDEWGWINGGVTHSKAQEYNEQLLIADKSRNDSDGDVHYGQYDHENFMSGLT